MDVFITGVAGFIGSSLSAALLAEGHTVRGIDDLSAGTLDQVPDAVDFILGDITRSDLVKAMRGAEVVFHLGAFSSVTECQNDLSRAAAIQVVGTSRVLEAARDTAVGKVIAAETSAVYEGATSHPTAENEDSPRTFYAITKRCTGRLVHAFARHEGLRATTLRYFNVYGPNQDYRRKVAPVIPSFIRGALRQETPVIYGDGTKRRDFIHIDDVNMFHLQAMTDTRTDDEVFNVGTGRETSIRQLLDLVQHITGTAAKPVHRPDDTPEAPRTWADISKARSIGWSPKIELKEGLEQCVRTARSLVR